MTKYSFYPLRDKQAAPGPFTVGSSPFDLQLLSVPTLLSQRVWLRGLGCSVNWELPKPSSSVGGRSGIVSWLCFAVISHCAGHPSLRSCGCLSWATACLVICQFFPARKVLEQVQFITLAWSPGTCPWLLLYMFSVFVKTYWSWESLWDWFQLGVFQGISSTFCNNTLLKHPWEKEWFLWGNTESLQPSCSSAPTPKVPLPRQALHGPSVTSCDARELCLGRVQQHLHSLSRRALRSRVPCLGPPAWPGTSS